MEELDHYLSGNMSADERRRFEEKLAADGDLQAEVRVREGLHQLHLQRKVEQVSQARLDWQRGRRWRQWLGIAAAVLLVSMAAFVFWGKNENDTQTSPPVEMPTTPNVEPTQSIENQETEPISPKAADEKKKSPPIAQRPINMAEQQLLRSAYEDLDPFTLQLLDSLLTMTRRLPQTDKNWQKAVRQLEEGKPAEAKTTVFQLEKTDAAEAKWMLALAQLAQGNLEEATPIFESIARMAEHPRQAAAKMALQKLRE